MRKTLGQPLPLPASVGRINPVGLLLDLISEELVAKLLNTSHEELLPIIEADLDRLLAQKKGLFLDAETHAAYYRGLIFTAIDAFGRDLLDRLGAHNAAQEFAAYLGHGKSQLGQDYIRFYKHRIAAEKRQIASQVIVTDIRDLTCFGSSAFYGLFQKIAEEATYDLSLLDVIKAFWLRSDSRILDRGNVFRMAWYYLNHIGLAEKLARSICAEAPDTYVWVRIWLAYMEDDLQTLQKLLSEKQLSAAHRARILRYLKKSPALDEKIIYREFQRLIEDAPADISTVHSFVDYLEEQKDYSTALQVLRKYLARPDHAEGVPELWIKTAIARMLHLQGKLEQAWSTVAPLIPTQYGGSYGRAALILSDMGKHDQAEDVARQCLSRYNDQASSALLARVLWSADKYQAAAQAIKKSPRKFLINEWRRLIGKDFVQVFKDRPVEQGKKAFAQLIAVKFMPQNLIQIPVEVNWQGHHALAFALSEQLSAPDLSNYYLVSSSYSFLKKAQGKETAMAWLLQKIPENKRDPLSQYGYEVSEFDLAWEAVPDPGPNNKHAHMIWLLRTAAYIRDGARNTNWQNRLLEYYEPTSHSVHYLLGAYLMGIGDEKAIFAQAKRPQQIAETAYYLGLAAQHRGDYYQAIEWFLCAQETKRSTDSEVRWAYHQLVRWQNEYKTMARLAEK
ncbi:hypothetical protein ACFL27_02150 [candidate division CSSED10-310 bacterium]|uniref:Tetratricopeptide repeat protein n=1 Tax=candidate division CSSED10-310 bacterium TaxID=2855610 RepID=A0ABV6YS09_UNCC1